MIFRGVQQPGSDGQALRVWVCQRQGNVRSHFPHCGPACSAYHAGQFGHLMIETVFLRRFHECSASIQ